MSSGRVSRAGVGGWGLLVCVTGLLDDARWVLLDYGDFVVHVFLDEVRRYYDLERLWSDVARVHWEPAASSAVAS